MSGGPTTVRVDAYATSAAHFYTDTAGETRTVVDGRLNSDGTTTTGGTPGAVSRRSRRSRPARWSAATTTTPRAVWSGPRRRTPELAPPR